MNTQYMYKAMVIRFTVLAMVFLAAVVLLSGCEQHGFAGTRQVVAAQDGELTVVDAKGKNQETHVVAADAEITIDGQIAALEDLTYGDDVEVRTEERAGTEVVTKIAAKSKTHPANVRATDALEEPFEYPEEMILEQPANPLPEIEALPESKPAVTPEAAITPEQDESTTQADPYEDTGNGYQDDYVAAEESFTGTIDSVGDHEIAIKDDNNAANRFTVNDKTAYTLDGKDAEFSDLKVGQTVSVIAVKDQEVYVAKMIDAVSRS